MKDLYYNIINNNKNKSKYLWNIIKTQKKVIKNNNDIPKVIIQYWDSCDSIPNDVLKCMETWKKFANNKVKYILYNKESARKFIEYNLKQKNVKAFDNCIHPALQADYFRLCYILVKGGAYIDSDDICLHDNIDYFFEGGRLKVQALCYDLKLEQMVNTNEAYNNKFMEERVYYVNNNPLIAPPNNPIIKRALKTATENLLKKLDRDFQAISGPGNLVNSIIWFYIKDKNFYKNIEILTDWDEKVVSKWPLDYRNDMRNWRNFKINME